MSGQTDEIDSDNVSETKSTDPEFEWVSSQNLASYAGRYISVVNQQIIASGDSLLEVVAIARKQHPDKIPFAIEVPMPVSYAI